MPKIFESKVAKSENENKENDNDNDSNSTMHFINPYCNEMIDLARGQIASILACCFFGIKLFAHCTFAGELCNVGTPGKMECWLRYFDFVRQKGMDCDWFNKETVTVWRRSLTAEQCACLEHDALIANDTLLCDFVVSEDGCIEDQA